jgi:hypothetical protein
MSKKRLTLDWSIKARVEDFKPTLIRYKKYLVDNGFRSSTIWPQLHDVARGIIQRLFIFNDTEFPISCN